MSSCHSLNLLFFSCCTFKGHAAPILYAAWAEAGLFPVSDLANLRKIDSDLEGHPTPVSSNFFFIGLVFFSFCFFVVHHYKENSNFFLLCHWPVKRRKYFPQWANLFKTVSSRASFTELNSSQGTFGSVSDRFRSKFEQYLKKIWKIYSQHGNFLNAT